MIYPNLSGDFAIYTSGFQPEADEVMNPAWFINALDIALDENSATEILENAPEKELDFFSVPKVIE